MTVEQIEAPASAREQTGLDRIDYADAFLVEPAPERWRPAEVAARAVLAEAPPNLREALLAGWSSLGLQLGEGAGREILGWRLRRSAEDAAVLAADSPLGIDAELVFAREGRALIYATLVRLEDERARAAWGEIEPVHLRMVRRLLERAAGAEL